MVPKSINYLCHCVASARGGQAYFEIPSRKPVASGKVFQGQAVGLLDRLKASSKSTSFNILFSENYLFLLH